MGKKKQAEKSDPNSRTIARNRKARHEYDILDELECGIVLQGSEVKSIRNNKISLDEAYARIRDGEVWLMAANIAEYPQATVMNHEPTRPRKLLMNKREIRKFAESADQQGLTLIPLTVYLKQGKVKVKIAIARGRKLHDKRDKLKQKADKREMNRALKR